MRNERGNVVALVLLILAVVSLVGAGTLMMSRYDLKYTAALRSYDKGFNLADGGATISYRDLSKRDREQSLTSDSSDGSAITSEYKTTAPKAKTIYCHCIDPANCSSASTKASCPRCVDRTAGDYDAKIQIVDYSTAITEEAGWEAGSYYTVLWNGLGVAERAPGKKSSDYKTANSTVQANVAKKSQTGN